MARKSDGLVFMFDDEAASASLQNMTFEDVVDDTPFFVIAVRSDTLKLTEAGLFFALRYVPSAMKRSYRLAYSWLGEAVDDYDQRWCLLKVAYRGKEEEG